MQIISDFPAYDMLSRWMTSRELVCQYCMRTPSHLGKNMGRNIRGFITINDFFPKIIFLSSKNSHFLKNKIEYSPPPLRVKGDEALDHILMMPDSIDYHDTIYNNLESHTWTKQNIPWKLPYWKDFLICNNLDVMNVKMNMFDQVINTTMDI